MTHRDYQKLQTQLLQSINGASVPLSIIDLVKLYQQQNESTTVPRGYVLSAIKKLLDSSRIKLRKDLKIESS